MGGEVVFMRSCVFLISDSPCSTHSRMKTASLPAARHYGMLYHDSASAGFDDHHNVLADSAGMWHGG